MIERFVKKSLSVRSKLKLFYLKLKQLNQSTELFLKIYDYYIKCFIYLDYYRYI